MFHLPPTAWPPTPPPTHPSPASSSSSSQIKALSRLAAAKEELADGTPLRNNVVGLREVVRSGAHAAGHSVGSVYLVGVFVFKQGRHATLSRRLK